MKKMILFFTYGLFVIYFTIAPFVIYSLENGFLSTEIQNRISMGIALMALLIFFFIWYIKALFLFEYYERQKNKVAYIKSWHELFISFTYLAMGIFTIQLFVGSFLNMILSLIIFISTFRISLKYAKYYAEEEKTSMLENLPGLMKYIVKAIFFSLGKFNSLIATRSNKT
jgi:hypothetical protein